MRDIQRYADNYGQIKNPANKFETKYQVNYRRKKVLEELKKYPYDKILEVGCGLDSYVNYIDDFKEAVIVEPSTKFADKARDDLKGDNRVTVICATLQDAVEKLKNKRFDFIIISGLLHELEQPVEFLRKINELCLRDHTIVHVNTPNAESMHRLLAMESGLIHDTCEPSARNEKFQQHTVFSMDKLKYAVLKSCEDGQIEMLNAGSYFMKPFSHSQMMQCLEQGIITEQVIEGLDRMVKYFPENGSEIFINYRIK